MRLIFFLNLIVFFLTGIGCSSNPPVLDDTLNIRYGYNYNPLLNSISKSISFFVKISDKDGGAQDIEKVVISSSFDDLSWVLNEDNWTNIEIDKENSFLGANDIMVYRDYDGGKYNLSIVDYAGKTVNKEVILKNIPDTSVAKLTDENVIPKLDIRKDVVILENHNVISKNENLGLSILIFNEEDKLVLSLKNTFEAQINPKFHSYLYVYLYDKSKDLFYRCGPYTISE